ncbi:MAG: hypothetical protein AAFV95_18790 [Bacteroidota bacterium]
MNNRDRTELKDYFENGLKPNQDHFSELIDSFINIKEDEVHVADTNIGIGIQSPVQKLEINGAIKINNTPGTGVAATPVAGTIRWTGTDFQGYNGTEWKSLTGGDEDYGIYIPVPRLCVDGRRDLRLYWEDSNDRRFLSFNPKYHLYRYKSRNIQLYKSPDTPDRNKPKKWVHPQHRQSNGNHPSTNRNTIFSVNSEAGRKQRVILKSSTYFKKINGIYRPRGQGRFHYGGKKMQNNRRFEYFKFRMVLQIDGKKVYGPFSETLAIGQHKNQGELVMHLGSPSFYHKPHTESKSTADNPSKQPIAVDDRRVTN